MPRPARRTQEERSAEMRQRLVNATIKCLVEVGYERTTTVRIVETAQVSRGALLHHFESKEDIITLAFEQFLRDHTEDIRQMASSVRSGGMDISEFLRDLWARFSGELFFITLEYVTEARHNARLHERLVPIVRSFHIALDDIWKEFFSDAPLAEGQMTTVLNMTLCLLRGMGLQTILRHDEHYYSAMLKTWDGILRSMIEAPGTAVDFARIVRS